VSGIKNFKIYLKFQRNHLRINASIIQRSVKELIPHYENKFFIMGKLL
jgi:hypothetical protein